MKYVFAAALGAAMLACVLGVGMSAAAETTPTPAPSTSAVASPAPTASTPAPSPSSASTPAPAPSPTGATNDAPSPDRAAAGSAMELSPRPAAIFDGKANRDEIYEAILGSIAIVRTEMDKAGLKAAGRPLAVFVQADDDGFRYRAEVPLVSAPEGKTELSPAVKLGLTPVGKAMRFEHRGAYDDIDATYEAITAYLDEKGIEAQEVFIEEYLNDVKTGDDPNLQIDIYVLLK